MKMQGRIVNLTAAAQGCRASFRRTDRRKTAASAKMASSTFAVELPVLGLPEACTAG
jgi:hypothetical protein